MMVSCSPRSAALLGAPPPPPPDASRRSFVRIKFSIFDSCTFVRFSSSVRSWYWRWSSLCWLRRAWYASL
jgi:hypothetical protein